MLLKFNKIFNFSLVNFKENHLEYFHFIGVNSRFPIIRFRVNCKNGLLIEGMFKKMSEAETEINNCKIRCHVSYEDNHETGQVKVNGWVKGHTSYYPRSACT